MMRPTQGMSIHPTHMGVIGFPVVMNNCPAGQEGWNSTPLGADAVSYTHLTLPTTPSLYISHLSQS